MRSAFRSDFGQNSVARLTTNDELGNVSHSLNEVLRKRPLVPPHELQEVSRYLKRSGLASHGTTSEERTRSAWTLS